MVYQFLKRKIKRIFCLDDENPLVSSPKEVTKKGVGKIFTSRYMVLVKKF